MYFIYVFILKSPPFSHPLCTFCNQVLHMWYTVNCLDLHPPHLWGEDEEEDLEVAKIYEAKDKHRKIMTGMYNLQCYACYSCRRHRRYSV